MAASDAKDRPKTPLRILQTGTYCSYNKGDAAMQLSTAHGLRERAGSTVVLSTPFPDQDLPFYRNVAEVIPCHRRRLVFGTLQLLRSGAWRLLRTLTGTDAKWLIPEQELQASRKADLVIDLSGDMLTEDYGLHVAYSHYLPLLNALLLDRPLFICAQSIGPFRWTGWIVRVMLERAAAITVRDRISLEHLAAIGLDVTTVPVTADMAFLLEPAPAERAAAILAEEQIRLDGRPILGVSLSHILEARHQSATESPAPFVDLVAHTLDEFAAQHDVQILLVPHVTGPGRSRDDREIGKRIVHAMRQTAESIRGDYRPEELKSLIGKCSLFLGARMHANIAALSSAVPVVALSYSHKTPGIMASFGLAPYVIPGTELSQQRLLLALTEAWAKRAEIRAKLQASLPAVRESARQNVEIAVQIIHRSLRPTSIQSP